MCFFILGFVLYSSEDIARAVRRDWWVLSTLGTACVAALLGMYLADLPVFEWSGDPSTPWFYLIHSATTIIAYSYSLVMLFVGMRFLNFTNRLLVYSQEAVLPFFMLHQPAIVVIAFFVVQWNAGIPLKLVTVLVTSFVVSLGLYELGHPASGVPASCLRHARRTRWPAASAPGCLSRPMSQPRAASRLEDPGAEGTRGARGMTPAS
jgi:hypothetical protein